ncbi:YwmB family TATA-box binding protein [Bacillus sp. FJAT-45066]|uniref:YwmB family TATA-box binding protein n=1 Tax=Bacillus sp. FJAT-45066 TaxID=2011010 RepID=UPI000BB8D948|nr:YwmB family TATA-box binding protein [Bacillus sp. FJAT-45066]
MKNWIGFIFIVLLCFTAVIVGNERSGAQAINSITSTELEEIIRVYEQNEIFVNEWKLYARENVYTIRNKVSFQDEANRLKQKMGHFLWEEDRTEDSWKMVGTYFNEILKENEKITLMMTDIKTNPTTNVWYEVHAIGWEEEKSLSQVEKFYETASIIFHEEPEIFSCVIGEISDIIEVSLKNRADELLRSFSASEMESLTEDTFISISAYNDQWERFLPTPNGKMNLQLGLRKNGLGDKITVVIGTPIITIEY